MGLLKQQDWTRSSSGQSPEEDQEAGGDKDSVEKDRIALPEPQLLELGLMKASAKGRIPEMLISVPSIRLSLGIDAKSDKRKVHMFSPQVIVFL